MRRLSLVLCGLALAVPAATASAQNRDHLQMFADLRMLLVYVQPAPTAIYPSCHTPARYAPRPPRPVPTRRSRR